jgi:sec-independent protein translocase protein TatA
MGFGSIETNEIMAFGFGSIGMPELLLIFAVLLLIFGGKKLPELARGLGKSIREFKKAASEVQEEFNLDQLEDDTIPKSDTESETKSDTKSDTESDTKSESTTETKE